MSVGHSLVYRNTQVSYGMLTTAVSIETANRPLEQLDILLSSESCLAWRAEREFVRRLHVPGQGGLKEDGEKGEMLGIE